jgi:hypothetical protein
VWLNEPTPCIAGSFFFVFGNWGKNGSTAVRQLSVQSSLSTGDRVGRFF